MCPIVLKAAGVPRTTHIGLKILKATNLISKGFQKLRIE
jgi:hypothetical protein